MGGRRRVFLVREVGTEKLWAAKFNSSAVGIDPDETLENIKLMNSSFDNQLYGEDYENMSLRTYIQGSTMSEYFRNLRLLEKNQNLDIIFDEYREFWNGLWDKGIMVGDAHHANIMFDQNIKKFVVVDPGPLWFRTPLEARWIGCRNLPNAVLTVDNYYEVMIYNLVKEKMGALFDEEAYRKSAHDLDSFATKIMKEYIQTFF